MDLDRFKNQLYDYNEDELFYKKYYEVRRNGDVDTFLSGYNELDILSRHLLVSEINESLPPYMMDKFFIHDDAVACLTMKHNRYSPAYVHTHDYYELIYVYSGQAQHYVNGSPLPLKSGDVCIIAPGTEHSIGVFDNSIILNTIIRKKSIYSTLLNYMDSDNVISHFLNSSLRSSNINNYLLFHTGNDNRLAEYFIEMYWECSEKQTYWSKICTFKLLTMIGYLLRDYSDSTQRPGPSSPAEVLKDQLVSYIQNNYKTVTLKSLSDHFHYSPEHASRIIKKNTGYNFSQILTYTRVTQGKILLLDSNYTVRRIAEEIGFNSQEHFIRTFKNTVNMTPSEFRKRMK